jgi:hypothetical protein
MNSLSFNRVAITAFLEPGGFGPLLVWSLAARDVFALCSSKPSFDPQCEIESLLIGGCERGGHPGRQTLEDHCRVCLAHPENARALQSGSAIGRRTQVLIGSSPLRSLDLEMGFLDLLIHAPSSDEPLPRSFSHPQRSMISGFAQLWGLYPIFCGVVEESEWNTYEERACAVLALMEKSDLESSTLTGRDAQGSKRL